MLFAKVRKKDGQKVHQLLMESNAFAKGYATIGEGDYVFFPITKKLKGDFELVDIEAEPLPSKFTKMEDALSGILNEEEREQLITSFDIIGDIAIVDIPEPLEKKEKEIANAVLSVHKNIKVVAKKLGPMEGEFRVRKLKVIAGEDRTETFYREHGVRIKLDVGKVYFSVRLSSERKRIAQLIRPNETILALFAGVGPFPLVIAKSHPDSKIVAIELNPEAVSYMQENIKLNKFKNIEAILGDAREVVLKKYRDFADRVLMPLPKSADAFLDVAIAGVKNGGVVHFYGFAHENEWKSAYEEKIREECKKQNTEHTTLNTHIVRPYAPRVVQVAIDFKVIKK